ncbi:MAG: hypothetical protein ACXAAQ_14800 [Candidatus Thorarchaeota archaeon]
MKILWEQAQEEVRGGRPEVAKRHMLSARKIAQKTRTKLPRQMSRRICKSCGTILVPGDSCTHDCHLSELWRSEEILPVESVHRHRLMSEQTRARLISDEGCS